MKAKYAIPLGFIGVILAGAGLFCLPVAGGLGFLDALFTSCSAVCITGLTVIDPGEIQEIIDEGKDISVSCQFCDREYSFTPADLRGLLDAKKE